MKIANVSPYWLQIKFCMSLFFYLFTLAINLWHRKFVTADASLQCLSTINMILSDEDKILTKSLYLKGCTAKRLIDEFSEKGWTKRSVNKLYKKLRDTCTVNRQPCSGRARSTPTEENAKLLLQEFPQSATDFVLPIVRWSDREHHFVRKESKVSGILRELLKQKLSALHASSTVGLCQLLCTVPLKTFQMQVHTNNLGYRRPMNTRLPWYLTDSPVGVRLFLLTQD